MQQVNGDETLSDARVFEWHKGLETTEGDARPGRPSTTHIPENTERVRVSFTTQSLNCRPNVVRGAEHQQGGIPRGTWQEKTE
jgi:hypothetical protein